VIENDLNGYRVLQNDETAFRLDEEAGVWLRDGSIHVKVVSAYGDPVELSSTEARLLAQALVRFADDCVAEGRSVVKSPP
jgi:hypothetical protein